MTIRLTNYQRDGIRDRTIEASFKARVEQFTALENSLALRVHHSVYTDAELASLVNVAEGWVKMSHNVRVNAGGYQLQLNSKELLPTKLEQYDRHNLPLSNLLDDIQKYAQDLKAMKEERASARNKVQSMLAQFTTLAKLADAWPEGRPYYGKLAVAPAPSVPVVQIETINAMLGLPIDDLVEETA